MIAAAVFDLDGVLTRTASIHAAAWKSLFDGYLRARAARDGGAFVAFDGAADYLAYVDGRPRRDGVRTFLASRGIALREGSPDDPVGTETVHGLAAQKDAWFQDAIDRVGIQADEGAVRLVRALRDRGVALGVASSSRHCIEVLERASIRDLFAAVVDGVDVDALGLAGKPAPDMFLECLRRLGTPDPARAAVLEDAIAGVAAGRAGGFGLVIGVDVAGHRERLLQSGADWVVRSLAEVTPEEIERRLQRPRGG